MYEIRDDQFVRIQNRIADVRENLEYDNNYLVCSVGELIATIETIFWDERSYKNADDVKR